MKKNFQALKSNHPIYKLHKVFVDFSKVIGESLDLFKVVPIFYKLHKSCLLVLRTL